MDSVLQAAVVGKLAIGDSFPWVISVSYLSIVEKFITLGL